MKKRSVVPSVSFFFCWGALGLTCLFAGFVPCAAAQEAKGCEGVGFAKHAPNQYSPGALRKRLEQNPSDVDALMHVGLRLEEQGEAERAVDLYLKAIRAKPDCALGYYFVGLAEDGISRHTASDAVSNINKAVSLDPSLRDDPNVESFLRRRSQPVGAPPLKPTTLASTTTDLWASANHFLIGIGLGLLLAAPLLYAARRKQPGSVR